jgi:hypothetical protein
MSSADSRGSTDGRTAGNRWARGHAERVAKARYAEDENRARDALRHLVLHWEDDRDLLVSRVIGWIDEVVHERDAVEPAPVAEDRGRGADDAPLDETVPTSRDDD